MVRKNWAINARLVETVFGGYVDWNERFYNCPECEEPIYECDWSEDELMDLCPVCGFTENEEEEDDEDY